MATSEAQFTAAEIGKALGKAPRLMRKSLSKPTGKRMVSGNLTSTWTESALPEGLRAKLDELVKIRFYRSVEDLLLNPEARWPGEGQIPALRQLAPTAVTKAEKLREAFRQVMARRNDDLISAGEKEQLGLTEYKAVFGHAITARHWRNLMARTLGRDRGLEEFERLELYVDLNPPTVRSQGSPEVSRDCSELEQAFSLLPNPSQPTEDDKRLLWDAAFKDYERLLDEHEVTERKAKEVIIGRLWERANYLGRSREAVLKSFKRKYERWAAANGELAALKDQRIAANENRSQTVPHKDLDLLTQRSVFQCGGRISQAYRELKNEQKFSEKFMVRFGSGKGGKSYVPTRVRDAVRHEIKMINGVHSAPKNERDQGAYLSRCWDKVPAGDWWCGDDCTLPVYYHIPDPETDWFKLIRGQFLLMIDLRTTYILGFVLLPSPGYHARAIRRLITYCADNYGLPRRGFYFEQGIWKQANILTGDKRTAIPWAETEKGLKEFGLEFKHATRARTKPVERVLGALQNQMERERGYAGRDERRAPQERFQKLKRDVEARRIHPVEHFHSAEQWEERLTRICRAYNDEVQEGKHTEGLSPKEAYQRFQNREDPPVHFGPEDRFLLAHHKKVSRVGVNGITLQFGRQKYVYRDRQTGPLRGQQVLVWFDPEDPDVITVTDLKRRDPFEVERAQDVPAIDPPEELLRRETAKANAHMRYAQERYQVLKNEAPIPFRRTQMDPNLRNVGQQIEQGRKQRKQQKAAESRRSQSLQREAQKAGVDTLTVDAGREDAVDALKEFAAAKAQIMARRRKA
jgi:hypothetical protein